MKATKRSTRKRARCSICSRLTEKAPAGVTWETENAAFVAAARKGNSATLEQAVHWHWITHYHLWRTHYDSPKAMLIGELLERGLPVPKPITLQHAYRVAREFGVDIMLGWSLLYEATLYWAAIGKNDLG